MFTGKASDKAADKGKEEDGSRRRALIGNGVYGGRDVYDVCGSICVCAFYNVCSRLWFIIMLYTSQTELTCYFP